MTVQHKIIGVIVTDIVNGQFIKQIYQGYTTAEAKRKFKQYVNDLKESNQL